MVLMRGRSSAGRAAWATAVRAVAVGCGGSAPSAAAPSASPTYLLPPRPARPFETPVPPTATATSGLLSFDVMGLRAQLPSIIGTHAEFLAQGQFVRVRIAVENADSTF